LVSVMRTELESSWGIKTRERKGAPKFSSNLVIRPNARRTSENLKPPFQRKKGRQDGGVI